MERGKKRTPPTHTPTPFFGGSQETEFFCGEFSHPGEIIIILNNTRIFFADSFFFKEFYFKKIQGLNFQKKLNFKGQNFVK
jgi:hypothetical protein